MQKNDDNTAKSSQSNKLKHLSEIKNINVGILKGNKQYSDKLLLEFYSKLSTTTRTGFWVYNPKKNTLLLSDELIKLLSLPHKLEILNEELKQRVFFDEDVELFLLTIKEVQENKTIVEKEFHIKESKDQKRYKSFRTKYIEMKCSEIKETVIIGIVEDITETKQANKDLANEIERTEESDRIKTTFLSNISHEIRTPMNAIIGFTELLNIGEISQDKRKEYLTIIKNKSRNLLSLIDDITELSKFESGEVMLNKTDTNLPKILNELHQEFSKEKDIRNKNHIDIYLKLPNDNSITNINTDSGRIQQVLSYLIDNALKYTEKGYIQFGYELKDNKHLMFFVKDTGIGIKKEAQKFLFNRFKIKEEVFDKKLHNTGLGLTISRSIIEHMGGKIYVESSVGHGSNFYFIIPFQKTVIKSEDKVVEKINPLLNWRNKVILIAEDDIVNFQFLEAVLSETQAQLIHVLDGKQAIEICKTMAKIDIILMDIRMPEKSGYEAVVEIKKIKPSVPIIAQTAYTNREDKEKCIKVGCDDYISKPIDINLLFELINKHFIN
jgi:signal transduction histidine kinase/CheY-like chemotaxis protein